MSRTRLVGLGVGLLLASGVVVAVPSAGLAAAASPSQPAPSASSASSWRELADRFGGAKSATRASRDVTMTFTFATEVREILVEPGDRVTAGQVLARARDQEALEALELARMRAENDLPTQSARAARDLADVKLRKLTESGTGSPIELEERRTELELRELELQQAEVNQREEVQRQAQLEASYERFRIEAPFDGVVNDIFFEVGQAVRETDQGLRLVNTEVLRLDAHADTNEVQRLGLSKGDRAWVLVKIADQPVLVIGRVRSVSGVAEAVSETIRVEVEFDNASGWEAGTQARVRFTEPEASFQRFAPGGAGEGREVSARDGERRAAP